MLKNNKDNVLHRLKIAHGHLEKVIKLVEDETYCLDIIQQTRAIESSLRRVDELILENHLKTCVIDSFDKKKGREEKIQEVLAVFKNRL